MQSKVYWIDDYGAGRLGIMARPRSSDGLEDDIRSLSSSGVEVLVSLLTESEEFELDLLSESDACLIHGIEFLPFPIIDRGVPPLTFETVAFIQTLANRRDEGQCIVIHCRSGVGRSALIAASILVMNGMSVDDAFARIERARGIPVPDTVGQRTWVQQFAQLSRQSLAETYPDDFTTIRNVTGFEDTTGPGEYLDIPLEGDFEVDLQEQRYKAMLNPTLARKLFAEARKRGIDVETLINVWLREKLEEINN